MVAFLVGSGARDRQLAARDFLRLADIHAADLNGHREDVRRLVAEALCKVAMLVKVAEKLCVLLPLVT